MFLLKLVRIDFRSIFDQGFRLVIILTMLVNFILLFTMHLFMVRPMYILCGHDYFSVISRWLFIRSRPSNMSTAYWEIRACCFTTNVLDISVIAFTLMFTISTVVETCLTFGNQRLLQKIDGNGAEAETLINDGDDVDESGGSSSGARDLGTGHGPGSGPRGGFGRGAPTGQAILRQRILKKYAFRRMFFRMSISLATALFASAHFIGILFVSVMFSIVESTLSDSLRVAYKSSLFALKWQIIIYFILSFFLCGFLWAVQGIYRSQVDGILERSKRLDQFRKMNPREARYLLT